MTIRQLQYRYQEEHGSGEGSSGSAGNETNTGSNNNTTNQNNMSTFVDLWNTNTEQNKSTDGVAQQQQQSQTQQTQQQDPNAQFDTYIQSLDFTSGIDTQQLIADLNEGKLDSFNNALRTVAANAYKQSLLDSQKIIQSKVNEAVQRAVEQSKGSYRSDMLVKDLHTQFPFTAAPEIEPVAKAVLNQLIDNKGMEPNEAIKATGEFFKHLTKKVASTVEIPDLVPGNQGFAPRGTSADEPNWEEIFQAMQ